MNASETPQNTAATYPPIVVMGVQGSGKTVVGSALARIIGGTFIDGDSLHSPENKAKMGAGTPLTDADRLPWLSTIAQTLHERTASGQPIVIASSALKRWYRELIRHDAPATYFAHLTGSKELIASRIAQRHHEYMPTTLLDSQFEALQPLAEWEAGAEFDITDSPEQIAERIARAAATASAAAPENSGTAA